MTAWFASLFLLVILGAYTGFVVKSIVDRPDKTVFWIWAGMGFALVIAATINMIGVTFA